jgi:hypothetical protein
MKMELHGFAVTNTTDADQPCLCVYIGYLA